MKYCAKRRVFVCTWLCHITACATVLNLEEAPPAPSFCERDSVCPPQQVCDEEAQRCVAACQPDARQCNGLSEQVCDSRGHWSSHSCTDGCRDGFCQPSKSCDLRPSCGEDAASCCEIRLIEGGEFHLPNDPNSAQAIAVERAVSRFGLDRFEVTIGRFRRFILEYEDFGIPTVGAGEHPDVPGSGWQESWSPTTGKLPSAGASIHKELEGCGQHTDGSIPDDTAVGCVSWYLANAFCIWDGGRLPTEAEWSFAAMGGDQQRIYPWSETDLDMRVDESRAIYRADQNAGAAPARVGSKPGGQARFGNEDMAGNVWEWVADGYRSPLRKGPCRADKTAAAAQQDCVELDDTGLRVQKGGAYTSSAESLRNDVRMRAPPSDREHIYGFRCARDLE